MTILEFMSESPWLTFFLFLIACFCIDGIVRSVCNAGRCPDCKEKHDKEMEDDYEI